MRMIDADHLIDLVNDATILGDGFKQAFTAIARGEPTIHPDPCSVCKWKDEYPWDHCDGCKAEGVCE